MDRKLVGARIRKGNQHQRAIDLRDYLFGSLREANRDQQISCCRDWLSREYTLGEDFGKKVSRRRST